MRALATVPFSSFASFAAAVKLPWTTATATDTATDTTTVATENSNNTNTNRKSQSSSDVQRVQCHEIKSRLLPGIHPLQLFRTVQDVDSYQDFLPLCYESNMLPRSIQQEGQQFQAELVIGFGTGTSTGSSKLLTSFLSSSSSLFKTRYISRVTVDPIELTIETISDGSSSNITDGNVDNDDNDDGNSNNRMFDSLSSCWKLRPYVPSSTAVLSNNGDDDGDGDGDGNNNTTTTSNNAIGTIVDFRVEMMVSDPLIKVVLNQVLYNVAETQVTAFQRRCLELPGPTHQELQIAEQFYRIHHSK